MGVDDGYKTSNEAVSRAKKMMRKQRKQLSSHFKNCSTMDMLSSLMI